MKRYTIHPIIAYIVRLSVMEGAHINELSLSVKKTTTVNKINDRNKMPTVHSGTFACPNTRATASQAKETEFLPTHRINK